MVTTALSFHNLSDQRKGQILTKRRTPPSLHALSWRVPVLAAGGNIARIFASSAIYNCVKPTPTMFEARDLAAGSGHIGARASRPRHSGEEAVRDLVFSVADPGVNRRAITPDVVST